MHDFAPQGSTIQRLATEAVTRIFSDWLLFLNDAGYYYPVAARNKNHRYFPIFHTNTWVLRGTGVPIDEDVWKFEPMGQFVALTSFNFDDLESSWEPVLDRKVLVGHVLANSRITHGNIPREDRVLYQWSAGGVVQSTIVSDSIFGVRFYELVGGSAIFDILYAIMGLVPDFLARLVASLFPGQTAGSDIAEANVRVYKHNGVVLTSLQSYHPTTRGWEQFPWVATVHDIAVFTQSGPDARCMKEGAVTNSHLPNIVQEANVALISYKPRWDVRIPFRFLGFIMDLNLQVALSFPLERFDEVVEQGSWIMGRRANSYVGVWRYSGLQPNDCSAAEAAGEPCDRYFFTAGRSQNRASVWAIVVGNDATHESFENFVTVVEAGVVEESSPGFLESLLFWQGYYRTKLTVDGKTLSSDM